MALQPTSFRSVLEALDEYLDDLDWVVSQDEDGQGTSRIARAELVRGAAVAPRFSKRTLLLLCTAQMMCTSSL